MAGFATLELPQVVLSIVPSRAASCMVADVVHTYGLPFDLDLGSSPQASGQISSTTNRPIALSGRHLSYRPFPALSSPPRLLGSPWALVRRERRLLTPHCPCPWERKERRRKRPAGPGAVFSFAQGPSRLACLRRAASRAGSQCSGG